MSERKQFGYFSNNGMGGVSITVEPVVYNIGIFCTFAVLKKCKMSIIELNRQNIIDICQKHKVKTLAVFGSVLTDRFSDDSDIDFVVDFTDIDVRDYADNYLKMQESLQNLFGRKIDLLENKAIRNSILLQTINDSKQVIYG